MSKGPKTLTHTLLKDVSLKAINLTNSFTWKKTQERWLHGVVLGLLEQAIGGMEIEYPVVDSKKRIDFRHGGNNPDVIEMAVNIYGNELYGSSNISELTKLCRIPYSKARRRTLLLLDPIGK